MRTWSSAIRRAVILVLAVGLTIGSLRYGRPVFCLGMCALPAGMPCPCGACRFGEQRAGFPLPLVWDNYGGGSPLHMMGRVGSEDVLNAFPAVLFNFVLDVLFYSALLSLVWRIPALMRSQEKLWAVVAVMYLLIVVAIGLIAGYFSYRDIPSQGPATAAGEPVAGYWRATDDASGTVFDFFFSFEQTPPDVSGFSMRVGDHRLFGRYEMVGERTVEISLQEFPWLCSLAPSLFQTSCQRSVRYPEPTPTPWAVPAPYPYPYPLPYPEPLPYSDRWRYPFPPPYPHPWPTPTPQPTPGPYEVGTIEDAVFDVEVQGGTMVLRSPAGVSETFRSMCSSFWRVDIED